MSCLQFPQVKFKNKISAKQLAWQKYFQHEAVVGRCSVKMVFLKISQNSQNATLLKRETCEFCEIFKNNYFVEHLQKYASVQ